MKAPFIAAALLSCVASLPVYSGDSPKKSHEIQAPTHSNKIDLNKADVSTLTGSFKGIGKKRAEAIISYRDSHSGFKSLEELADVKGFGQHFVKQNREKLNEVFVIN